MCPHAYREEKRRAPDIEVKYLQWENLGGVKGIQNLISCSLAWGQKGEEASKAGVQVSGLKGEEAMGKRGARDFRWAFGRYKAISV